MEPTACGLWPSEEGGYGAGSQLPLGKAVKAEKTFSRCKCSFLSVTVLRD